MPLTNYNRLWQMGALGAVLFLLPLFAHAATLPYWQYQYQSNDLTYFSGDRCWKTIGGKSGEKCPYYNTCPSKPNAPVKPHTEVGVGGFDAVLTNQPFTGTSAYVYGDGRSGSTAALSIPANTPAQVTFNWSCRPDYLQYHYLWECGTTDCDCNQVGNWPDLSSGVTIKDPAGKTLYTSSSPTGSFKTTVTLSGSQGEIVPYKLSCTGSFGADLNFKVGPGALLSIDADPQTVKKGLTSLLQWLAQNTLTNTCSVAGPSGTIWGPQTREYTTPKTYSFIVPAYTSLSVTVSGAGAGSGWLRLGWGDGGDSSFGGNVVGKGGAFSYIIQKDGAASGGDLNATGGGAAGGIFSDYPDYSGGNGGQAIKKYTKGGLTVGSSVSVVVGAGGVGNTAYPGTNNGANGSVVIIWTPDISSYTATMGATSQTYTLQCANFAGNTVAESTVISNDSCPIAIEVAPGNPSGFWLKPNVTRHLSKTFSTITYDFCVKNTSLTVGYFIPAKTSVELKSFIDNIDSLPDISK